MITINPEISSENLCFRIRLFPRYIIDTVQIVISMILSVWVSLKRTNIVFTTYLSKIAINSTWNTILTEASTKRIIPFREKKE